MGVQDSKSARKTGARIGHAASAVDPPNEPSALASIAPPPLSDQEFALFQRLIFDEAGIYLSEAKRSLVVSRLSGRLRALGLTSFGAYYRRVKEGRGDGEELTRMLDCISTNETQFFREPKHFDFIAERLIPAWTAEAAAGRRKRRVRAWSAACSTGEEPFSLAMTLLLGLPPAAGWSIEILATDLSTRVLSVAEGATWSIEKADEIPLPYLKAFMLKGTGNQEGKMRADPLLRSVVQFRRLNLNDRAYLVDSPFDLIFCRNVLIYFSVDSKRQVVERLLGHLAPDGYLFMGHAESLHGVTDQVQTAASTVYTRAKPPKTR